MMFRKGTTRYVILVGNRAIKVARIRPIRPIVRLLQLWRQGRVRAQLLQYDKRPGRGAIKYLTAGIRANRFDNQVGKIIPELCAEPTLFLFGGFILVQKRGGCPTFCQVTCHPFWPAMLEEAGDEENARKQFGLFDGETKIVDTGRVDLLCPVLGLLP